MIFCIYLRIDCLFNRIRIFCLENPIFWNMENELEGINVAKFTLYTVIE